MTFDNTGLPYDPTQIVTNGVFDQAKFEAYSPVFMPATLAVAYGVAFAAFASVIVHTLRTYPCIGLHSHVLTFIYSVVPSRHPQALQEQPQGRA